ncbi:hypothetical protein C0991_007798 [Blastosporella zonata]|nr:hypothetical protein C0991_007798 [Blastosporella zonata]
MGRSTTTARAVVGIPTLLICGLIIWCIRMFWERTEHDWTGRVRTFFENDVSEINEKPDETTQEDVDEKGQDDRSATIRAGATAKMDFVDGCSTRTAFSRSNIHWPLSLSQLKRKDSDTSSQA